MGEHPCGARLQPGLRVDYGAMQYADGGDMLTYLRGHDVSPDVARRHFVRIASAVLHLHKMGWAHRDVSLENVLLVSEAGPDNKAVDGGVRPLLGDYGLAVRLGDCPAPIASRPGKPGYMCPEIYSFKSYNAAAADVYSLGVVLFGLLARALPYNAPTHSDVAFRMIQSGQLADLLHAWSLTSRFRGGAMDLVERMLSRDPAKRPSMKEVLRHPWCAPALEQCGVCLDDPTPVATCQGSDEEEAKADSVGSVCCESDVDVAVAPAPAPAPASQPAAVASHMAHTVSGGLPDGATANELQSDDDGDDSCDDGSVASPMEECDDCVCDASMSHDDMQRALGRISGGDESTPRHAKTASAADEVGAQAPPSAVKGAHYKGAHYGGALPGNGGAAPVEADAKRAAGAAQALAQAPPRAPKPPVTIDTEADADVQQQQHHEEDNEQQDDAQNPVCPTPVTCQQRPASPVLAGENAAVQWMPRHRLHMRQPLVDQGFSAGPHEAVDADRLAAKVGAAVGNASVHDSTTEPSHVAVPIDSAA